MRTGLTFLFLLAGLGLMAQIFGPVAVPVDPDGGKPFSLEGSAGVNFTILRTPNVEWVDAGKMRWQPGLELGLVGVFHSQHTVALELGLHVLQERGTNVEYGQSSFRGVVRGVQFDAMADRVRQGDLTFSEWWMRGQMLLRIRIGKFSINPGVAYSGILTGEERFDFTQTTNAVYDLVTDTRIELEEPFQTDGSIGSSSSRSSGFISGVIGLGYRATDRLYLNLQLERGLRIGEGIYESDLKRGRLGLMANYRLLGGGKRTPAE